MKQSKNDINLGRCISFILRHRPEDFNIKLDSHGWADVNELISNMNIKGHKIDRQTLDRIVRENNKQRYTYNQDGTKIRANQGHSIKVDVELSETVPPQKLYHGTAKATLDAIREKGIMKMTRNHVHLSSDIETAFTVGKRHGNPVVLVIDTAKMYADGIKFYISENKVWLCDYVAFDYVMDIIYKENK